MELLLQRCDPQAMVRDPAELGIEDMSQFDPYENESQNAETFPILDEELGVTPEWGEQYLNREILRG